MVEVHESGGATLVNEVLFDQLGFLVDHFEQCESFGCPECGRYIAVRDKLMTPFVEVPYQGFAIAEQRRRGRQNYERVLGLDGSVNRVRDASTRTQ